MTIQKAVKLTLMWIFLALLFNLGIYFYSGQQKAMEFLAGYLVELSLSVDNLFVFLLIFSYFKVPPSNQSKILFWGVLGAQLMRGILIFAGIALLNKFVWLIYVFGAFLAFTGIKLLFEKEKAIALEQNSFVAFLSKRMPMLMVVLIVVELMDLVFALDSIPAVLAITKDPLIVYSSNIFAVLGLRAMFFALAGLMTRFHYLHYGLGLILTFVGVKMLTEHVWHCPIILALGFIIVTLIVSVVLSVLFPTKDKKI